MSRWTAAACAANGIDIHVVRTGGAKPPLLLLHGLIGSGVTWTPIARALEDEYDVVMPDARGHGNSSAPPHGYAYEDHARDVMGLIEALRLARPVLMGHSMGGMTAALTASRLGRAVRGVILVDPTFLSPARQREVYDSDVAEQHRRQLGLDEGHRLAERRARHRRRLPEMIELQARARTQTRLSAFEVLTPPNPPYRELVSLIQVPVLLAIGDTNPVVSPEMARELQELNAHVRLEQIEGAGHGLPFDQPERLAMVARSFMGSLERPSAA